MDKKVLSQYMALLKEIEDLSLKIENCKDEIVADSVKSSNANFPYQEITTQIIGISENKHRRKLYKILNKRLEQARDSRLSIEKFISEIDDSQMRYIFGKRYIDGWSWNKISKELGKYYGDYARVKHDRFLKSL
ncbi:hypothetical protein [Peptoniphilus raoultii]|uniref:hypothetical protein n=1 Tax=Peptoniphilus raoultii TaxID=1776387 RepID=UPI0008DB2372|nr:hypothetical protein [Peptoniphilus raoultii]